MLNDKVMPCHYIFLGLSDHQKVFIGLLLQFIKLVSSCSQQIMLTSQTTMR
jgi:hypothetical protein